MKRALSWPRSENHRRWWTPTSRPPKPTCWQAGPRGALALIEGALAEAASIHAATLLPPARTGSRPRPYLPTGEVVQARTALDEGLRQSSSPDVAHERGFLLAVAARIARHDQSSGAAQLEQEADDALRSLGVVRVPLPDFAG